MFISVQLDLERANHVGRCSFEFYGSPLSRHFANSKVVFFGEPFHFIDRAFIGAALRCEFFPGDNRAARPRHSRTNLGPEDD